MQLTEQQIAVFEISPDDVVAINRFLAKQIGAKGGPDIAGLPSSGILLPKGPLKKFISCCADDNYKYVHVAENATGQRVIEATNGRIAVRFRQSKRAVEKAASAFAAQNMKFPNLDMVLPTGVPKFTGRFGLAQLKKIVDAAYACCEDKDAHARLEFYEDMPAGKSQTTGSKRPVVLRIDPPCSHSQVDDDGESFIGAIMPLEYRVA